MQDLVLRDIHYPPAPSLWPLAPGWWLALAVMLLVFLALAYRHGRRRRRRRAVLALFDAAVTRAQGDPPAEIAAISSLLRRAALRRDAEAATLDGEAWLGFLDAGDPRKPFSTGPGPLLLDGAFRRDVEPRHVAPLRAIARERFLGWMAE